MAVPALAQEDAGGDGGVQVTDYGTVTLAVQDTDLAQVLEMLSIQSQKNIITSKNVSATVSANLYDVTFYEALDAILHVNGYDYVEEGNFIYIYTTEEIEAIKEAARQTESRIYELEYLSASDGFEFIQPLLSEAGQASYRGDVEPGIDPSLSNAGRDDYAFEAKLVVSDYPENLEGIAQLLSELDTPPQQVLVETTVLQTTLDERNAFGVDFSVIADMDFLDLTDPLGAVSNLLAGSDEDNGYQPPDNKAGAIVSSPGNTAGPGTFKFGLVSNDVSVFVKLLDEVTDTTVLSRPKILCLNRQRAQILVGVKVGYLSTTATETTTTETVEFLDTGVRLNLRPFISRNGMVRLELAPSLSEALLRTVSDREGIPRTIPDEFTNEITTNVRVQEGKTVILGGLFAERTSTTRRQVPLIGDIPILGAAFRGNDDDVQRDEIIFLITPNIMHDQSQWTMGDAALDYLSEVRVGMRQGLLPFSRERQTESLNVRANTAYEAGEYDAALNHINHSLHLNPHQPGIRRLRETIQGEADDPYEWSILRKVLDNELMSMSGNDEAFASNLRYAAPIDFDAPLIVDQTGVVIAPPTPEATVSALETLGVEFEDYDDGIDVDQRGMVSMSVQNAQLTDVLDSLASASGKDAVVHESVTGTVSADLQDVKFQQALASILHDHGYDFMVEDDLVYVFPTIDWELVTASAIGNDYQATAWAVSDAQKRGMGEDFIYEYLHTLGMTDVATYQGVTVFEPTSVPTLAPMTATATPQPIPAPAARSSAIQPFVDGVSPVESEYDIDELSQAASADGYAPFDDE